MKNITTALMCFSFTITIFAQNDICTDAISVSCGDTVTGSTIGATSTGAPSAFCGTGSGAPGVWYEFTGTGQDITFSLCGSSYDTKIQVYSGECADLECVAGNDDSCGLQSEVSITSTENEPYFVYVFGYGSNTGDYTLEVSCEDAPEPPACGDTIYDTGGASGDYGNNELITVTVFPENPGDVVTFTFLSFDIESGFDFLTVYNGPDTSSTEIGEFTGSTIPDPITSTDISGALTFVFDSDGSVTRAGYEILITCAPPPTCLAPTDFATSNITANSVDISWTANNGEAQWEYVIQPQGTGIPTSAGTPMTTNPYTITGLDSGTDYEIFIRAICDGGDSSAWTSPVNITTSPACGDTIFDSGGANGNYSNNELITLTVFPENTGDVVTFTFISFDLESGWDFITVYNGPDTSSTEVGEFTGSTAPDPITSTDATGALTFVFDSDGVINASGYEILITCAPPPSCLAPTGLTISNISGTTADFDWETQNGNESWEYVIVPAGDPAPTATGIFTVVNSTTFTDLDFLTTYDVYVRAYCGTEDGYSTWSGPKTFTTTQQTDYTVDCGANEIVNINYCYTNDDNTYWVFTSNDGYPLKLTFNEGTIDDFDNITIFDGADNSGTVLFNNNDAGLEDLSGVVIESTSTSIYIEVDSSSFTSCESSFGFTPWDFDVSCKTCITQTVEFDIVGSCEPNQEFYIEANITDMGSAMNLELTDNQGSATQTATATSVVTFGPYAANTQVVISVLNTDDTSCLLESDPLTFLCPPPPNECSIVYAGEDTTFCSDNDSATVLTASYHIAGQDTTSYDVTLLDECPAPILEGGTPTSIDTDDIWSEAIDLGFDFCFFGETYSQILIGSNGVLSFELENAGTGNGWDLQGFGSSTPDQLPNSSNTTISEANIFGVGHDINPAECGEINYMVLGSAPARQFVVNYNDVCHFGFSCSEYTSTSQIILYESSNFIDVNIIDKPICTEWNDGLAVVGIQNIDDTIAFTPEDRNTSAWEASNESWRFSPSVGEADYVFEWYDGDTLVGTEDTITVYPEETTTYTAAVTYNLCNGETATVTDTVLVEITPTPIPIAVENDVFICAGEEAVLEVNIDASAQSQDIVYYWTYDNVDIQSGPENSFMFAEGAQAYGEYLVTAYNEETACYASTVINVLPGIVPELEQDTSFNKCINGEVELSINIINDPEMTSEYNYAWYVDNELIAEDTSGSFIHGEDLTNGPVVVMVTNLTTSCASETIINVNYFQNQNCVDIPQGISPNGDGLNDCLVLDHLEEQEDIVKAEIYNRYGVKVFELNDYVDHWCGQDASGGSSDELLPVGTYFYVIQYASGREPTISWIYLNY
jgi:gliding motility-associated-like protein